MGNRERRRAPGYLLDLKRQEGHPAMRAQAIIDEYRARYHPPKRFMSLAE
jgi:hypothetical protein